ncbi:putative secretory lipase [Aspergillus clavatus NRRL 1]|uniref:Secretory lipase, putative n=1 Tax=Aspergillus clavatus (strain ATCC 1007 / CBS 513.65 / DSM 816 / NCTC 3887 / NRRL 1 / QM 1276 / 107) TaxID=344612 RepID=A1C8A8_ASPCL|nr:secretory lipase, putative [Aspergillus clavatus NRRL 1]EAW14629.1 secretory lipase, putative [Aspergillus clavatus NRRL 1]
MVDLDRITTLLDIVAAKLEASFHDLCEDNLGGSEFRYKGTGNDGLASFQNQIAPMKTITELAASLARHHDNCNVYIPPHFAILVIGVRLATGQSISVPAIQSTAWNASFELSPEQLKLANLTSDQGAIINTVTNFDRSQQTAELTRMTSTMAILLVQGKEGPTVPYNTTKTTAQEICKRYPADLELLAVRQGSHFAAINAAKQIWLRWIDNRFEHRRVDKPGCIESPLDSLLPLEYY